MHISMLKMITHFEEIYCKYYLQIYYISYFSEDQFIHMNGMIVQRDTYTKDFT